MSISLTELYIQAEHFEARPSAEKCAELLELIDYLSLEEHITSNDRRRLKGLRARLAAFDAHKPAHQHMLSDAEIMAKQMRLMHDCERLAVSSAGQLDAQLEKLEGAQLKLQKVEGKLLVSGGLLVGLKRSVSMNVAMLTVVVFTVILMFLIVGMMKVFG